MQTIPAIAVQIGLIFGPLLLFFVLKSSFEFKSAGIVFAIALAFLSGWGAFYFASEYGWQPRLKSGKVLAVSPGVLFWIFAIGIMIVFALFLFVQPAGARPHEAGRVSEPMPPDRGWRVGHRGRDGMFYEEFHEGAWLQISIDGEMLMGRAHHVIYFASTEKWRSYPEWAAGRRDEIIGRIKSEFREPDYEYYGG